MVRIQLDYVSIFRRDVPIRIDIDDDGICFPFVLQLYFRWWCTFSAFYCILIICVHQLSQVEAEQKGKDIFNVATKMHGFLIESAMSPEYMRMESKEKKICATFNR